MKEVRCDEEGNPVEIVEVSEGQEVQLHGGGPVHVYIHLEEGVERPQSQKSGSGGLWWLAAGFVLAWMVVKWF
ncbi:MAG: hypothetical protein QXO51_04175 [Halobacteria archaeon]